jgi:hypothetical protein
MASNTNKGRSEYCLQPALPYLCRRTNFMQHNYCVIVQSDILRFIMGLNFFECSTAFLSFATTLDFKKILQVYVMDVLANLLFHVSGSNLTVKEIRIRVLFLRAKRLRSQGTQHNRSVFYT